MRLFFGLLMILSAARLAGQDPRIAENYIDQGEYSKALKIYEKVYSANRGSANNLYNLIQVYQQLESYKTVDSLLTAARKFMPNNRQLFIEQGYNKSLQSQDSLAEIYYDKAIMALDTLPQLTYQIAARFEQRNLLDQAVSAYEKGQALIPSPNFSIKLAQLYGEQGEVEKMINAYVDIVEQNDQYQYRAQAVFSQYINEDPENEPNKILRKVLLTRLRGNPDPIYNQLLSWLFIQQKDFKNAFIQEKAIYRRNPESIGSFMGLVYSAVEESDIDAAREILDFMIAESQSDYVRYNAGKERVKIISDNALVEDYGSVKAEFKRLLELYGRSNSTYGLQLYYADFLAFKNNEVDLAIELLSQLEKQKLNPIQKARVKMKLGDILVLQEQFNRALILYTQVQNDVPNNELAQESQFKVARTSYFQGDFPWSLTQLKVLRGAASKLIANDAMELSLTISDHSQLDTAFVALKSFAKADLLQYQNKRKKAIEAYKLLLREHSGDPIEDEAHLNLAKLYELEGEFELAAASYQRVIDDYPDGILADDALYLLARLYEDHLALPDKAKILYESIIYNHADSIHLIDARRRFRRLRGDETS